MSDIIIAFILGIVEGLAEFYLYPLLAILY